MTRLSLVALLLAIGAPSAFAERGSSRTSNAKGISTSVEPIIGYERVQKLIPTAHTKDRLIYGARISAGLMLIAGEAEYIRGTDTESFPTDDLTIRSTGEKAKIGVRTHLHPMVVRAGVQASRSEEVTTQGGVVTTVMTPIEYHPYAGAGVKVGLGHNFAFSADLVAVFKEFPKMDQNEYQTTAGFSVNF